MTESRFLTLRSPVWDKFEALLDAPKKEFKKEAAAFPLMLQTITGDLNTARALMFDPLISERLNRLVLDGNQILCSCARFSTAAALRSVQVFLGRTFPACTRTHWKPFISLCALFYGIMLFSMLLCIAKPDFAPALLGDARYDLYTMYDKTSGHYLKPRAVWGDADMFAFYIYNNASICFASFAGGVLAGAGSILVLVFNGFFLGAAAGFLVNAGFAGTFFSFTAAHSAFELTGIVLAACAGLILGYSFFVPRGRKRFDAVQEAGKTVFPLISGAVFLIFLAAIIEAFFSSKHNIAPLYHYAAGVFCWLLLVAYFVFCGKGRESGAEAPHE